MIFTIFHARNNRTALTGEERDYLFGRIDKYFGGKPENSWLLSTQYRSLQWYWCSAMNAKNGVLGAADPARRAVYLMQEPFIDIAPKRLGFDPFWCDQLFPAAIHELRHVWQYNRSALTYTLLSIPFLREITLERDAWKHTPGGRQ